MSFAHRICNRHVIHFFSLDAKSAMIGIGTTPSGKAGVTIEGTLS